MFCGWQRHPDEDVFRSRSNGHIEADVLEATATLDGKEHDFNVLHAVYSWLIEDLEANNIPRDAVDEARFELTFSKGPWEHQGGERDRKQAVPPVYDGDEEDA